MPLLTLPPSSRFRDLGVTTSSGEYRPPGAPACRNDGDTLAGIRVSMPFMQFVPREMLARGIDRPSLQPRFERIPGVLRRAADRGDRHGDAAVIRQRERNVELKLTVDDGGSVRGHDLLLSCPMHCTRRFLPPRVTMRQ